MYSTGFSMVLNLSTAATTSIKRSQSLQQNKLHLLSELPNLVKSYLNINVSQLGGKKPQNLKLYIDSSWEKHVEKQKIKLHAFQNKHIWFILVHRSHDKIGESVPPAVFHMVPLRDGPQRISGGCSESRPWPCFLASQWHSFFMNC